MTTHSAYNSIVARLSPIAKSIYNKLQLSEYMKRTYLPVICIEIYKGDFLYRSAPGTFKTVVLSPVEALFLKNAYNKSYPQGSQRWVSLK